MLHGLLDYICFPLNSRPGRNFAATTALSTLITVDIEQHISETDVPPQPVDVDPQFVSPDNPPWNTLIAFALWFLSVILIFLMPVVFLFPYIITSGSLAGSGEQLAKFATTDPTAVALQMLAVIPAHIFTLIFAWIVITRRRQFSFWKTLGMQSGGIRWWHHVLIFLAFAALAMVVSSFFPETENELTRILKSSRAAVLIVAVIATFSAPLVEEVVYRGVLYSALQRSAGIPAAVAIVTLMFASVHVLQYYESPSVLILITVLSLILTLMRSYSKNLLPCIIFHTVVNGVQSLALLVEPYANQASDTSVASIHLFK